MADPDTPLETDLRDVPPVGPRSTTMHRTDRLILDVASAEGGARGGGVAVIDDETGDLVAGALDLTVPGASVLAWSRSAGAASHLAARFASEIDSGRLRVVTCEGSAADQLRDADVRLALAHLPKSLRSLDATARELAASAAAGLTLVAGGRVKHMTRTQNDVLAASFEDVRASLGSGKSRCLIATSPRADVTGAQPEARTATVRVRGEERELALRGSGGVFGGAAADAGSLLLLRALDELLVAGEVGEGLEGDGGITETIDLGSGNGLLTAYLAAALPQARVLASDDDLDAVASTRATLSANGLAGERVRVAWDASLSREPAASADLVLLNPPFHDGPVIDATLVQGLLDATARVLRPGGELWFVHNSHLRYRPEVERRVGPVRQAARDRRFTVLRAVRGPGPSPRGPRA